MNDQATHLPRPQRHEPAAARGPRGHAADAWRLAQANPSSLHAEGRAARAVLEHAREAGGRARRREAARGRLHQRRVGGDRRGGARRLRPRPERPAAHRRLRDRAFRGARGGRAGGARGFRRGQGPLRAARGESTVDRFLLQLGDGRRAGRAAVGQQRDRRDPAGRGGRPGLPGARRPVPGRRRAGRGQAPARPAHVVRRPDGAVGAQDRRAPGDRGAGGPRRASRWRR